MKHIALVFKSYSTSNEKYLLILFVFLIECAIWREAGGNVTGEISKSKVCFDGNFHHHRIHGRVGAFIVNTQTQTCTEIHIDKSQFHQSSSSLVLNKSNVPLLTFLSIHKTRLFEFPLSSFMYNFSRALVCGDKVNYKPLKIRAKSNVQ